MADTVEQIDSRLRALAGARDRLKTEQRTLLKQRARLEAQERAAATAAALTPEERTALVHVLSPEGIASAAALGTPGE